MPDQNQMSIQMSDKAGADEGLTLTPGEQPAQDQTQTQETKPEPAQEQVQEAKPEETPAGSDQPQQEDPDIALPDGSTVKWSTFQELRTGGMKSADYTQKTQALAEDRRRFDEDRKAAEEGFRRILADPQLYEQARREQGLVREIDPFTDQETWLQARQQQYVQAGRQDEATPERLRMDLLAHQNSALMRRVQGAEQQYQAREQAAREEQEAAHLDRSLTDLFGRQEYQAASTPAGREMVEAFIAREVNMGNESPDLEAIVRRVANMSTELVKHYAGQKQEQARRNGPLMRGGGQPRAPGKKDFGTDLDSFRRMAQERSEG